MKKLILTLTVAAIAMTFNTTAQAGFHLYLGIGPAPVYYAPAPIVYYDAYGQPFVYVHYWSHGRYIRVQRYVHRH